MVGGEGDEVGWEVFAAGGLGMDQSRPPPSVKKCKFFSKKGSECSETKEYAKYVKILQGTCVLSR